LAILLTFAAFRFGGSLVSAIFGGLRLALGYAAYLLPLIFAILAWLLFHPESEVGARNYVGFAGFTIALAGLLHITASSETAVNLAQSGQGGGYTGLALSRGLLAILNVPASTVILLAVMAIFLVIAANARISDIAQGILGLFRRGPREDIQINEPAGLMVNNKLPFKGHLDASKKNRDEEQGALTG
jgi:hypothetical protein